MNSIKDDRVYMRSLATRQANLALSAHVDDSLKILIAAEYDLIILETSGIGQSDTEIIEHSDVSLYVMTPEFGAPTQLEKIDMLDFADVIAINKFDKSGAKDALRDVKKQYARNHNLFDINPDDLPVFGTSASQFNDSGMNRLYEALLIKINEKCNTNFQSTLNLPTSSADRIYIIPPNRIRYLSEITESNRGYIKWVKEQSEIAQKLYALQTSIDTLKDLNEKANKSTIESLKKSYDALAEDLETKNKKHIETWPEIIEKYGKEIYSYTVRNKELAIKTVSPSLSHSKIPKVVLPKYKAWGDILYWILLENVPGEFP